MSRREDIIKAASAGLQPKSLDLTSLAPARSASRVRSTMRVSNEDAAFALGFAAGGIEVDGERYAGDPLGVALLRLKYAEHLSLGTFERALALLLHHSERPVCETLRAVATAALVEWLNDRCPECRVPRGKALHPGACPECKPVHHGERLAYRTEAEPWRDPWGKPYPDRQGAPILRLRASTSPANGCPKCHGLGRIFAVPTLPRGMRCASCGNSGLVSWRVPRRARAVSELLVEVQKSRGQRPQGLRFDAFARGWHSPYVWFIVALRAADKRMGAAIDFGYRPSSRSVLESVDGAGDSESNRAIESGHEENLNQRPTEPNAEDALDEPEEPAGEVPPKES